MKKTVFLDRDGTLIIDKVYLNDPDQIEYLPGVFESLVLLKQAGYQFIIVTNQSGVPRGLVSIENLNETHLRIEKEFKKHGVDFAGIYYAAYSVESEHPLRKPKPGMLLKGAEDHAVDLAKSWMIGDRVSDVVAGARAGCRTVLLVGTETVSKDAPDEAQPTILADGLLSAARQILKLSQ